MEVQEREALIAGSESDLVSNRVQYFVSPGKGDAVPGLSSTL